MHELLVERSGTALTRQGRSMVHGVDRVRFQSSTVSIEYSAMAPFERARLRPSSYEWCSSGGACWLLIDAARLA